MRNNIYIHAYIFFFSFLLRLEMTNNTYKEAIERNKNLDFVSNPICNYEFRTREREKEIQGGMHFTPKTSLERIEAFLKEHTQTQVEVFVYFFTRGANGV